MPQKDEQLIQLLCTVLPERRRGKRGPAPLPKKALVRALFWWLRTGCAWRYVEHSASVRRYFFELQRRGILLKNLKSIISLKYRPHIAIADTTNINTWINAPLSSYSGKYHNYCTKLLLFITNDSSICHFSLYAGSLHDSKIFDKYISQTQKLPYELFLDKGFESYPRRRFLKSRNCQVRMQQRHYTNNKKRGPRFLFSHAHKKTRVQVESHFAYLKAFHLFRYFRFRKRSTLNLALYIALFLLFHPDL